MRSRLSISYTTVALLALATFAMGQQQDACPMRIEVAKSGAYFTNRFHGRYKTSPRLLENNLRGGCYNDNNPSKVTSVTVQFAPGAPRQSIEKLYEILQRNGWPKSQVIVNE